MGKSPTPLGPHSSPGMDPSTGPHLFFGVDHGVDSVSYRMSLTVPVLQEKAAQNWSKDSAWADSSYPGAMCCPGLSTAGGRGVGGHPTLTGS